MDQFAGPVQSERCILLQRSLKSGKSVHQRGLYWRNKEQILALVSASSRVSVVVACRFQRVQQHVCSAFQHYLGVNSQGAQSELVGVAGRGRLLRRLDDSVSASSVEEDQC